MPLLLLPVQRGGVLMSWRRAAGRSSARAVPEPNAGGPIAVMAPQRSGNAPGWKFRKDFAGRVSRPWAKAGLPQQVGGICQNGWHTDCPQKPGPAIGEPGTCGCPCHQAEERSAASSSSSPG